MSRPAASLDGSCMTGNGYPPKVAAERLREVYARREMRRRLSYSWWAWLLDTTPEQLHQSFEFPRTAVQEARRQWLRAHISWAFLARFQTAFAMSLAAALPAASLLIQQIPDLRSSKPAHVLGWCVLAGFLWLTVCGLYRLLVPRLMKAVSGNYAGEQGNARRQLLAGLIGEEFDRLITIRPWPIPDEAELHFPGNRPHSNDVRAREMAIHGYLPVVVGFGPDAQARIERAIIQWAALSGIRVIEASANEWMVLDRHRTVWEGRRPYVRHLAVRQVRKGDALSNGHLEEAPMPGDLLLEWTDAPLDVLSEVLADDGALHRRNSVEGLERILESDTRTDVMASLVAQWTNWHRPWARFGILLLTVAVLVLIGIFATLEIFLILHAMRDGQ
jgi:hypothetical protein